MKANRELIGLSDTGRKEKKFPKDKQKSFIGLADVPDLWWRTFRGKEGSTHFADVDEKGKGGG